MEPCGAITRHYRGSINTVPQKQHLTHGYISLEKTERERERERERVLIMEPCGGYYSTLQEIYKYSSTEATFNIRKYIACSVSNLRKG